MKNRPAVTVGIPVFNDEKNIKKLLDSIFIQKEQGYRLKEIIVISDGSTDNSIKKVKEYKDKRIKILNYPKREGKASRVNTLFKLLKSDILLTIDSDMVLKDTQVINRMTQLFRSGKNVGLVAGNPLPLPSQTFIENAINNYIIGRNEYVGDFSYEKTAYIARAFLAYSNEVAKKLRFPNNLLNEDAYAYFYCILKGHRVYFQKEAIVLYRSPQTLKDMLSQFSRHYAGGQQLKEYYPSQLVDEKFILPLFISLKILIFQLIHNPLGYIFLKIASLIWKNIGKSKKIDVRWQRLTN